MTGVTPPRTARSAAGSLARVGLAARGAIYLIVGWLALQTALGVGNAGIADKQQALRTVGSEPMGTFLLLLVSVGLLAYATWSVARAVFDFEHKGRDAKALAARFGYAVAAASYGALGLGAMRLALGLGGATKGSDEETQDWTARLLETPIGPPLVIGLGLIVLGVSLGEFARAYRASFQRDLRIGDVPGDQRQWLIRFGRLGYAARGVVFTLIGAFFIQAARRDDPGQAVGLGGALQKLADFGPGAFVLGAVAAGLCLYGLFSFAEARYRRSEA